MCKRARNGIASKALLTVDGTGFLTDDCQLHRCPACIKGPAPPTLIAWRRPSVAKTGRDCAPRCREVLKGSKMGVRRCRPMTDVPPDAPAEDPKDKPPVKRLRYAAPWRTRSTTTAVGMCVADGGRDGNQRTAPASQ